MILLHKRLRIINNNNYYIIIYDKELLKNKSKLNLSSKINEIFLFKILFC